MHTIDAWPILTVGRTMAPGATGANQQVNEEFFAVLGDALERAGDFGIIVDKTHVDPNAPVRRTAAELDGIRWLKVARERIGEHCVGIAYVLSAEGLADERSRRGIEAGPQVYGCATEAFGDDASARRWLVRQLETRSRGEVGEG